MARWDALCTMTATVTKASVAAVKQLFDLRNLMRGGCYVKKRPDCCALCRANNDCSKIPMHVRCHCVAVPYLSAEE